MQSKTLWGLATGMAMQPADERSVDIVRYRMLEYEDLAHNNITIASAISHMILLEVSETITLGEDLELVARSSRNRRRILRARFINSLPES